MESEKFQILKLVQEGKVSAEEGARLLQAVEQRCADGSTSTPAKWLRMRVQTDGNLVSINLPIALLDVAVSMGLKFIPKDELPEIDIPALLTAIKQGATGKVLEVVAEEATVEITVE
ncbi:MAG: hypothetical protein DDT34_00080 [Firmicutes bacterium]|nr:hypothetical protein [Bacillota bacterium]MBT9158302.1 hypothetical protein [Bacillota bacterium]